LRWRFGDRFQITPAPSTGNINVGELATAPESATASHQANGSVSSEGMNTRGESSSQGVNESLSSEACLVSEINGTPAREQSSLPTYSADTPIGLVERDGDNQTIVLEKFTRSLRAWRAEVNKGYAQGILVIPKGDSIPAIPAPHELEKSMDLNATIILYENGKGSNFEQKAVRGEFPNQKVSLYTLFNERTSTNPLFDGAKNGDSSKIQYFHLPANNMEWVEVLLIVLLFYSGCL
jgi:hypothetical protein